MKPEDEIQPADQTAKHSRYGIASFVISLVNGFLICCFLIVAVLFVGLRQQNFRKQFCKLGIGLNGIPLFFGGGFLLLKYFGIAF